MAEFTPMMKQYFEIKNKCQDAILFYRLGDFYEMFFDDAITASKILELVLTGRDCGQEERAPMCGVPYHSVDPYIAKLIENGFKVAICEQIEDVSLSKGLVKRDIVRIITPGTLIESNILDEHINNYLVSIYYDNDTCGFTYSDISIGHIYTTQFCYGNIIERIFSELSRLDPSEIIINNSKELIESIKTKLDISLTIIDENNDLMNSYNRIKNLFTDHQVLDPQYEKSFRSVDMLISYLFETQKNELKNIDSLEYYTVEEYMMIDPSSRKNLELTQTFRDRKKKGSLIHVIDKTVTSMGSRLLNQFINQPLIDISNINKRLDAVEEFYNDYIFRMKLTDSLNGIYDIERILSRLASGSISLKDLISLKNSLYKLPNIKELLSNTSSKLLIELDNSIELFEEISQLVEKSIIDEPPVTTKDGGYIKEGYDPDLDELIEIKKEGTSWIRNFEKMEKERTDIKNLKIKYNKVFGYFIEITNSYSDLVPETYIRKQTLANSERYITQELKEIEDKILGADSRSIKIEAQLLLDIKAFIINFLSRLKATAYSLAYLDVLCSFAEVSAENNYVRPEITVLDVIDIKDGRHPVVETIVKSNNFVPNDVYLDLNEFRFSIITGPNMAGKSTYMRQTALIVLMAQIGCFVPAKFASIGIVDKIFTRVGASDDLSSGQSTFMIEMSEVANILHNSTNRSLLILDEIGRGTSTFDGLSIAWAVTEYISKKENIGARTLFATHYHELTELEGKLPGVMNYCVKVLEEGDDVIFLRKIVKGGADESFGIHVAKLAGIPQKVIDRAKSIAEELKKADINRSEKRKKMAGPIDGQINVFEYIEQKSSEKKYIDELTTELRDIDISKLTPIEALNRLYQLQSKYLKGLK